ncbi:MAG: S-methyl-5'-thioadenosine phosphorylase [Thermomicrobium sp.]|nr:S-methyl-5'-thioadenosine phosphorylase [Thermomicrobium sp.]MDW8005927.1 S-methyl-5'-thioadenosine phosphorylase [Thermomicrobium sp.]
MQAQLAVLGGSGLYRMADLEDVEEVRVTTPFGEPSDTITIGTLRGMRVAFLPRHGRAHQHSPSRVPARANFWALKSLGVRWVVSVSAVGSLREEIRPLDFVVPDQVVDRTVRRARSFFDEEGPVVHVALDEPFCPELRAELVQAAIAAGPRVHQRGTYLCIEGPQFSTKAESHLYRSWGMDIIGMTAMPEVRLAREAELCFAILALVTDYDVWHSAEEPVSVSVVLERLHQNVEAAQRTLRELVPRLRDLPGTCSCSSALQHAIVTRPEAIPREIRERYALLLGKYLPLES